MSKDLLAARRFIAARKALPRGDQETAWHREGVSPAGTPVSQSRNNLRNHVYLVCLLVTGCLTVGFASFFAWANPAVAAILNQSRRPTPTQENLWAAVDIPKPAMTPVDKKARASGGNMPQEGSVDTPTNIPAISRSVAAAEATDTPGSMIMEIIADTPVFTNEAPGTYPAGGDGGRWIDVNLSEQRVYAYEGDVLVNSFLVSTGLPATPTVTGQYKIYVKVRVQDMSGPGYYLRDVPWVMYFYESYGFHGTYWHNNFGRPMSRGCVNLTVEDAAWLYDWASIGTVVNIHY